MSAVPPQMRRRSKLGPVVDGVERAEPLDRPAGAVARTVRQLVGPGPVREAAQGEWLGHAVHPMLTDVVIGSFTSASALDLLGARGAASERLIALGIVAYVPTALTGAVDWTDAADSDPAARRVGIVHAVTNGAAFWLYVASLRARRRGARLRGALLGFAGLGALTAGGYLGAHLTLVRGVGIGERPPGPDAGPATPEPDSAIAREARERAMSSALGS